MKTKNSYRGLFAPQSIAIVGASNKKNKIGTILADNILKLGYHGRVYFVNPSYRLLRLKRCYASLGQINKPVDLAIVAVPAKFVLDTVKDGAQNVKNFVIISAGFSEIGQEGVKREQELANLAKKYKLNILGPNCLGFLVPALKLNASFAAGMPPEGNIAFISQSGAIAVALMDMAKSEHLGFSHVISVGNKMQVDETDLLEYLSKDRKTKVIGMYLEGIKDGGKFMEMAKKVSKLKPIVILKAGKTEKSQKAISSHTGALAGSDEIMDVAFERSGITRANDLEDFFNLLILMSFAKAPANSKVAVITNAGGAGVLATDAFKGKQVFLADLTKETQKDLREFLPEEGSVENPIDLLGDAQEDRYAKALQILDEKKIGSILCILTPQDQTPVAKVTETLIRFQKRTDSMLVASFIGSGRTNASVDKLKQQGIPNFSDPERAVRAINAYWIWKAGTKQKNKSVAFKTVLERKNKAQKIVQGALKEKRKALLFMEASNLMSLYGIKSVETRIIKDNFPAKINYPVVVKIDSDTVLHKSDKQGVVLGVKSPEDLASVISQMKKNFPGEQIIVQRMQNKDVELILGIKRDNIFGTVVVAGFGGIYTEIFKAVDFYLTPMNREEIEDKILASKLSFLFKGFRGQKKYDLDEFARIIEGLMLLGKEVPQIVEVDVNPLFVYNMGESAVAADIKVVIA